ncbi:hypothetical protein E4V01_24515 [Methylorubrum sp. Q1]|nr:hypothetical protein E4V01_24515 [Methylorubrum sp. Q1]
MEPMKPMEPMSSVEPLKGLKPWWPQVLGQPSTSGGQNGMRYAFFPDKQRLLVEIDGKLATYDSGDHRISGVSQPNGRAPSFSTQDGDVNVNYLKVVG